MRNERERVLKLAAVIGSPDADNGNACRQLKRMADEGGITVIDLLARNLPETPAETEEMRETLMRQEKALTENVEYIATLEETVRAMNAKMSGLPERGKGFIGLIKNAWGIAEYRLLLLSLLILCRMALFALGESNPYESGYSTGVNMLFVIAGLAIFVIWAGKQYERCGLGTVVMKTVTFFSVVTLATATLFGFKGWREWFASPVGGGAWQYAAFALMGVAIVTGTSKFTDCLSKQVMNSDFRPFEILRMWFLGDAHE